MRLDFFLDADFVPKNSPFSSEIAEGLHKVVKFFIPVLNTDRFQAPYLIVSDRTQPSSVLSMRFDN